MSLLSDYHFDLPPELIAQTPLPCRSDSRLLCLSGAHCDHKTIRDLPNQLKSGDRLVFNDTKVIPARVFGHKASGGKLELMLERITERGTVLAKIRCSKSPKPDSLITLTGRDGGAIVSITARVIARHTDLFELQESEGELNNNRVETLLNNTMTLGDFIAQYGDIPLPPYIERKPDSTDLERYQTVFAQTSGAVAAPTAGLHFDEALLSQLAAAGIDRSFITLHVGAGTFQPVRVDNIQDHEMHAERVDVSQQCVDEIESTRAAGGRIIAVGTTCVRSLEAAAQATGRLSKFKGETQLFVTPGFSFNVIDAMLTNFHLPESTLLMLVSAFAGKDNTLAAYLQAVEERYRFFSYGDAMLVWPNSGLTT